MSISRRYFLGSVPALAMILRGRAAPARLGLKETVINRFSIAGFQYYQGEEVLPTLEIDDYLRLVPEPANFHDRFAVEIFKDNNKIGYVPRSDNKHISRLLREGICLVCWVAEINFNSSPWNALKVNVSVIHGGGHV